MEITREIAKNFETVSW